MSTKGRFDNNRTFGIEIECLKPRSYSNQSLRTKLRNDYNIQFGGTEGWKIVGDISVGSHPPLVLLKSSVEF